MGNKHKKEKKHKKNKERHNIKEKHRSSSSSDSSDEWVEKESSIKTAPTPRDEWMMMETCFSGKSRKELKEEKKIKEDISKDKVSVLDQLGQSDRELNPFWKNGGTGLPSENRDTKQSSSSSRVGDNGVKWLKKALERAKEQAEEDGRSLDDVISERWGSLNKFNKLLKEAEKNEQMHRYGRHGTEKYCDKIKHNKYYDYDRNKHKYERNDDYGRNRLESDRNKKRTSFRKPDDDDHTENRYTIVEHKISNKNWKKPIAESSSVKDNDKDDSKEYRQHAIPVKETEQNYNTNNIIDEGSEKIFSINELNNLCAAALRAQFSGNMELARKLHSEAKFHKLRRKTALENKVIKDDNADKVVILTETDNRGFTRPVKSLERSSIGKRKAETHEGQKRIRYFADDDKYSLNDMFEREKYNTADDDQNMFLKLVIEEQRNDMGEEGVFDKARMDQTSSEENKKRARLIKQHIAHDKALENCRWCIGSKTMMDECVVLSKSNVFVAAPTSQSLTEKHCLIIPHNHVASATLLDEDVWSEIMELRKQIVQRLAEDEEDIIFFEIANNLHKHPHMVIHCVPVPKEIGDTAPIYFKKAILECETEWSNNKKVVDLAGRDIRKAVPKGLPYFAVDFGMQSGYAHVIEDNKLFSSNFGQEIIGGMLDLDHTIWRKPRRDLIENIVKKVELIKQLFEENT